jgi:DNA ligase-1
MRDAVELVVVGAYHGRGNRAGTYGELLLSAYNPDADAFETVTKCGTGYTNEDLAELYELMRKHVIAHRHLRVRSSIEVDAWVEPVLVLEIFGAEIALSPIYTCAKDSISEGSGLAVRFPRFTGNYGVDKSAEDATRSIEMLEIYRNQLKRIDHTRVRNSIQTHRTNC